ncbi:DinB family protein [Cyclobacterium jeungdonense]|uniref:DinB family protein n=1 Tax=Cyclobacterium jeungdonense TaxID=708087 RepID=A0ABT8CBP0_9BACT|nr:DinB family protein [Cyclobacterium jeungdonense]MDN3689369.1 DinB family protein [Cyclobacterium jeungdonense]
MKKNAIIPSLTFLLLMSGLFSAQAQTNMEEFMAKWENSRAFTLETIDAMPDDLLDYQPHESAMSFKEQVTHIGGAIASLSKGFLLGEEMGFDPEAKPQTKEEMKGFINQCYDYGKETISALGEEEMNEKIDSFAGKITRRQMVGLVDDHTTHHRGAAISYIRANGIEPPAFRGL